MYRQRLLLFPCPPNKLEGIFKEILEELNIEHVHLQVVSVALIGKEYNRDSESDDDAYRLVRITLTSRQAATWLSVKAEN